MTPTYTITLSEPEALALRQGDTVLAHPSRASWTDRLLAWVLGWKPKTLVVVASDGRGTITLEHDDSPGQPFCITVEPKR